MNNTTITVQVLVNAPIAKVWEYWNKPEHITHWAFASDDWEALSPENDLRVGGKFKTTMAAKDKSASFDFGGVYTVVNEDKDIEYDGLHLGKITVDCFIDDRAIGFKNWNQALSELELRKK